MTANWCHPSTVANAVGQEPQKGSTGGWHGRALGGPGRLPALGHGSGTWPVRPHPGQRGHSEGPAAAPSEQTRGVLGGQLEQRSPDTRGPQGSEAQGPSLAGQPRGTRRLSPGRGARYLHDRLGEVPRAPVTEARLHRGRDEAFVSGSIVRVIGRLRALGKQRRETSQSGGPRLCAPPTPALPTRPAAPWPLGALPCRPHCCALVTGTRVSGQNSRALVLGSARGCTQGALSPGPARWLRLPPTLSWLHTSPGPGPHRPLPRGCGSTQARRPAS